MEEQGTPRLGRKGKKTLLEPGARFPSDSRAGGAGEGELGGSGRPGRARGGGGGVALSPPRLDSTDLQPG